MAEPLPNGTVLIWPRAARVVDSDRIATVVTAGQEPYRAEEAAHGVPGTVLVQPENKTAPFLILPLLWIARRAPGAGVAVPPGDHFVRDEERFAISLRAAPATAGCWLDRLLLLGAGAEGPGAGYGWIALGVGLAPGSFPELRAVRRFWEKPDRGRPPTFSPVGISATPRSVMGNWGRIYAWLRRRCRWSSGPSTHSQGSWAGRWGERRGARLTPGSPAPIYPTPSWPDARKR